MPVRGSAYTRALAHRYVKRIEKVAEIDRVMDDRLQPARWPTRQRLGLALHATLVAALVPAFLALSPGANMSEPIALVALAVMAVVVDRHDVPLPNGIRFDALMAVALIAVAIGGPLPAYAIALVPMVFNALTGHERLLRAGNLANLAAYGWYTLAGGVLLQVVGVDPTSGAALGWLVVAGIVQMLVNWAVGPAIYGPLWLGHPLRAMVDMLVDVLPVGAVMIALGAIATALSGTIGLLALALLAAIAVLPQSFLTYAARARPAARLDAATATRRYAHALGVQLGLTRAERRHLAQVARAVLEHPPTGDPIDYACATMGDPSGPNNDAQLVREWWDGRGRPIGLRSQAIPLAARVVAVAETWSALTARDTPQLSHEHALSHLEAAAGTQLDPKVVEAAHAVIAQERVTAAEPAPEPRLHHLRLPAALRRALAAG
jgi:hypothetical protein